MTRLTAWRLLAAFAFLLPCTPDRLQAAPEQSLDPRSLAGEVTIYRDDYGVPHIDGKTDAAVAFGFAYAQAEDNFWQVEDSFIMGIARYGEVLGERGIDNDLLNRAFEIADRSPADFEKLDPNTRSIMVAFTAGLNYYLEKNPEVKPRIITKFEPWHMLAHGRMVALDYIFRTKYLPRRYMPKRWEKVYPPAGGSNAWAIAPSRTKDKTTILFCNPHQPSYGYGQFYEAHLRSGEGLNVSGATFFGAPTLGIAHNEYLGWSHTVNRPDTVDYWDEVFDDPANPLKYRYADGYRTAVEWKKTFKIKQGTRLIEREYSFKKTHHGPILAHIKGNIYRSFQMAKLYDTYWPSQHLKMGKARNFQEFQEAMRPIDFPFFNTVYADRDGNIYFVYNGAIPRRDPSINWDAPLDGTDPRTEWQGYHLFDELPQVLNPRTGYIQSCNSSPFTTTDDDNPLPIDFPDYMTEDGNVDNLRSKVSRLILRDLKDTSKADIERLAYDSRMYWPMTELPRYRLQYERLKETNPALASQVAPYIDHLLDWDCINTEECTQSPLIAEWYQELYGTLFPPDGELLPQYANNPDLRFAALVEAAKRLEKTHGSWKVRWGDIYRAQRHPNVADFLSIPFDDRKPSLPSIGVPGGLGAVLTQYYTPSVRIPLVKEMNKHYGIVGTSYMAVFEFKKDGVDGSSLIQYGSSGNPKSPHYMDQAKLLREKKFKPAIFDWKEITKSAKRTYRPGEEKSLAQ
ncbi:MAG: penicillin acylase family protein [Planctomycetota bacterium]